jgi:hypothetical protein
MNGLPVYISSVSLFDVTRKLRGHFDNIFVFLRSEQILSCPEFGTRLIHVVTFAFQGLTFAIIYTAVVLPILGNV